MNPESRLSVHWCGALRDNGMPRERGNQQWLSFWTGQDLLHLRVCSHLSHFHLPLPGHAHVGASAASMPDAGTPYALRFACLRSTGEARTATTSSP
jgi:hypothetical protein